MNCSLPESLEPRFGWSARFFISRAGGNHRDLGFKGKPLGYMKKTNIKYRAHDGKFARRYEGLTFWAAYIFIAIILWALLRFYDSQPLVSPVVMGPLPVYASESVRIPCEKGVAEYLECLVIKGEITEKQAKIMLAIGKAESGLRERAANSRSSARGVFQIIAGTWYDYDCVGDKYDWKDNTKCAIKIMHRSGFTPWEVYNTGSYKNYLNK